MTEVGKCPKCDHWLTTDDINQVTLRLTRMTEHAYVCKKCNYIIGFGARHLPGMTG